MARSRRVAERVAAAARGRGAAAEVRSAAETAVRHTQHPPGRRLLVGYGWIVGVVWVAYGLLWLGLGVPGLRRVLARATLTRWYRRYRGPGLGDSVPRGSA